MPQRLVALVSFMNPLRGLRAAQGAWAVMALLLLPGLALSQTPQATTIMNTATAQYQDANGTWASLQSNTARVLVQHPTLEVRVDPDRELRAGPSVRLVLPHTVTNLGNQRDTYAMEAVSPSQWPLEVYVRLQDTSTGGLVAALLSDASFEGEVPEGYVTLVTPLALDAGESVQILLVATVPAGFGEGMSELLRVTATSTTDPSVSDAATDLVLPISDDGSDGGGGSGVGIRKSVDRDWAQPGDLLTYTIAFTGSPGGSLAGFVLTDSIPAGATFISGSLSLNGRPLSDARDEDEGEFVSGVVQVRPGSVVVADSATVNFQVRVDAGTPAAARIFNRAWGSWPDGAGTRIASDTATTRVFVPELNLRKRVVGSTMVSVGDEVRYRIVATHASTQGVIRDLRVRDQLPPELLLVSTDPAVDADGAWRLEELSPGDSAVMHVTARVISGQAGQAMVNVATASWSEASGMARAEAEVWLGDAALQVDLSATTLNVAMGETVVLYADVSNTGRTTLDDVLVELILPPGTRFVPGSLDGAAFVSLEGDRLVVRLPGSLVPGASRRFIYSIAVVSPDREVLVNLAEATADAGTVRSNVADAVIRLRGNRPVETRTVVGQIWLDLNLNGRPDEGETGFADVDIWTEDGAVSRTDAQGRFSFTNLRVGTHHLRIDPATLPPGVVPPADGDGMVTIRVTGWNTPLVRLPVWTREAALAYQGADALHASASPSVLQTTFTVPAPDEVASNGNGAEAAPSSPRSPLLVAPSRSEASRETDAATAMVWGPGVELLGMPDGAVSFWDAVFLVARAEPNVPIALFRGDELLSEGRTRGDGLREYVDLRLEPGPNLLRARVTNSWGRERWDSLMVHVSGVPASIAAETPVSMPADGRSTHTVRARVIDQWGVPVVTRPFVTVRGLELAVVTGDQSRSSSERQVQADEEGWVEVQIRASDRPARGSLILRAGDIQTEVQVDMLPPSLPFMLMGSGQVGVGAAPDAYGAVTARGQVGEQTSLTLSLDTRRLDDGHDGFGRVVDPFSEGLYPVLGDAAQLRSESAARGVLSARLERGFDYLVAGDIQTTLGDNQNSLARYSRSLTGAAARIGTGPLTLTGFGSLSSQALRQFQLRALGTSGPYLIDQRMIPGTEQVHVEVRDRDNAQRVVTRRQLFAFVDYQIDYLNGTLLLKQPLPASDAYGNPVFLVVTAEATSGGDRSPIVGVRVEGEANRALFRDEPARVVMGGSFVHDGQGLEPLGLAAADVVVTPFQGTELRAEFARSSLADTTGFAAHLSARITPLAGRVNLGGAWRRTEDGFRNPSNLATRGATDEFSASAAVRLLSGDLRLLHTRQEFGEQDIIRQGTSLTLRQALPHRAELDARLVADDVQGGSLPRSGNAGEFKLTWNPVEPLRMWAETRGAMGSREGDRGLSSYYGGGLAYEITQDLTAEARHLQITGADGEGYSMTNFGLRSQLASGMQAWGSYQLLGGIDGAGGAALVGLNHRLSFGDGWRVNGLFERRAGLDRAPLDDPLRALPFPQAERDYWSTGLGVEHVPESRPYRFSVRGERKQGEAERFSLGSFAGDVTLGGSLALLARQDLVLREPGPAAPGLGGGRMSRRASILGLALRPEAHQEWNALLEFRWLADQNPRGTGLFQNNRDDERLIAATEVIWAPGGPVELGVRYAARFMRSNVEVQGFPNAVAESRANYLGATADVELTSWASFRTEARYLDERRAVGNAWDVAPALVLHAFQGIELTAGHRWGTLRDRDFAVSGGAGFFLTLGARVTERTLPNAAAFWRSRIEKGGHGDRHYDPSRVPPAGLTLPAPATPPSPLAPAAPTEAGTPAGPTTSTGRVTPGAPAPAWAASGLRLTVAAARPSAEAGAAPAETAETLPPVAAGAMSDAADETLTEVRVESDPDPASEAGLNAALETMPETVPAAMPHWTHQVPADLVIAGLVPADLVIDAQVDLSIDPVDVAAGRDVRDAVSGSGFMVVVPSLPEAACVPGMGATPSATERIGFGADGVVHVTPVVCPPPGTLAPDSRGGSRIEAARCFPGDPGGGGGKSGLASEPMPRYRTVFRSDGSVRAFPIGCDPARSGPGPDRGVTSVPVPPWLHVPEDPAMHGGWR